MNDSARSVSYRDRPFDLDGMPPGVPYIVSNEAAERFSFYGMRGILVVFMTQYLLDSSGAKAPMTEDEAKTYFHLFTTGVYLLPLAGALIADTFLGKYRTIILLSLVYCLGHLALAMDETRLGLSWGLALIAVGSGGIKPCVSAHVGDQFGPRNEQLLTRVFMWFYWSINLGAFASNLATPWLLEHHGPRLAFGVPGILMALATVAFWMGRNKFVHIPAHGASALGAVVREALGSGSLWPLLRGAWQVLRPIARLFPLYAFVAAFWALFDQTGSSWVLQATRMDTTVFGWSVLPSQVQAINPVLILAFIPLFSYVVYPALERVMPLTPLRKVMLGFFLTVPSFLIPAYVEARIGLGEQPSIGWHFLAYALMTAAEVMVSITCLEFSYTQAPRKMKSLVMGCFLMSVSLGNAFTAGVNFVIQNDDGTSKLAGPSYYLFFAGVMLATAVAFVPMALRFREERHIHGEPDAA
jgi:POT family proton-dependent oligopeptide transporter